MFCCCWGIAKNKLVLVEEAAGEFNRIYPTHGSCHHVPVMSPSNNIHTYLCSQPDLSLWINTRTFHSPTSFATPLPHHPVIDSPSKMKKSCLLLILEVFNFGVSSSDTGNHCCRLLMVKLCYAYVYPVIRSQKRRWSTTALTKAEMKET